MRVTQEMIDALKIAEKENIVITNEVMFRKVWEYVKNIPELADVVDILDYTNVSHWNETPLSEELLDSCELVAMVNTGGSEGIYIDYYLLNNAERKNYPIATIKTLREDMDAYIKMGKLSGALLLAGESFFNFNYYFM